MASVAMVQGSPRLPNDSSKVRFVSRLTYSSYSEVTAESSVRFSLSRRFRWRSNW